MAGNLEVSAKDASEQSTSARKFFEGLANLNIFTFVLFVYFSAKTGVRQTFFEKNERPRGAIVSKK
ncbi:MAG: hypothetical protein BHW65_00065 [Verrucomicrobia bacterium CAG:312_58_20]|nr:MAG: hypothetical protein BHW65_00065 [Verrucomicrobia bacterium CAG:312_58_20]PWL67733.1 MAG: hypothetical protein DBY30_03410 [Verrucomicrobiota bacterium]